MQNRRSVRFDTITICFSTERSRARGSVFTRTTMAWKCPACQANIRQDTDVPRPGVIYRCHICRLELVVDPKTNDLVLAPFRD